MIGIAHNERLCIHNFLSAITLSGLLIFFLRVDKDQRNLNNALKRILFEIKPVLIFFIIVLVFYANITYVEKLYDDDEHSATYWKNFIMGYNYAFGNWEYREGQFKYVEWTTIMHILYSFLFAIILTNILITKVGNVFGHIEEYRDVIETGTKINLIFTKYENGAYTNETYEDVIRCYQSNSVQLIAHGEKIRDNGSTILQFVGNAKTGLMTLLQ